MRRATLILLMAAAITVCSTAMFADTTGTLNIQNDILVNSTLHNTGGANYTETLSFQNISASVEDIFNWSLQLFNANGGSTMTITSVTFSGQAANGPPYTFTSNPYTAGNQVGTSNWEFFSDNKAPNSNGGGTCGTNSNSGWLCADGSFNGSLVPLQIKGGTTLTFTLGLTALNGATPIATQDLVAQGCLVAGTCSSDGGNSNANKWAVSVPLQGQTVVPEPASMALFGTGLFGMAGMVRRRMKK